MSKRKSPKRPSKPATDDAVGYGSPPKAYQFKPGQSGNPKGRPKGAKNLKAMIADVLTEPVSLTKKGVRKSVPAIVGIAHRFNVRALNGDIRAAKFLFDLFDSVSPSQSTEAAAPEDRAADRAIMEGVIRRLKANTR